MATKDSETRETRRTPAVVRDPSRIRRLRSDAARPMNVNLAEGIALSHKLISFTGAARRS